MKYLLLILSATVLTGCQSTKEAQLVTSTGNPYQAKPFYPEFSWETVPVYMMFADDNRLLEDKEVRKIAAETDFICIEKNHGQRTLGDAELGLIHEKKAFKALKPSIKVLAYQNAALAYPFTHYIEMLTPQNLESHPEMKEHLMIDPASGDYYEMFGVYGFNVLNPNTRAWWSDSAANMVKVSGADGIFIDQMHGFEWLYPVEQRPTVAAGVADMLRQLKEKIGPEKILLANNGAHIDAVFEIADAFMFEHYNLQATHTKEKLVEDWQLMEKIAEAGKICIYRFGAKPADDSPLAAHTRADWIGPAVPEWAELSKEQLPFHLAVYLIGAQPYAYFQWNWGWALTTGPLEHYPEFHKPLGAPLAPYKRETPNGWIFTRSFEHANVWVDLEKREGRIDWN